MGDFETRKNLSRRLIIRNSPKKRIKVRKKCANILIILFLMINKLKMDFVLFGVDQTKIKQSKKSSTYYGFLQNLISTKNSSFIYHKIFSSCDINQKESSFI